MPVLLCKEINTKSLQALLQQYGMQLQWITDADDIPGSFWKDEEAGLIGNTLYVRNDTPLHSALHEACHYICMDDKRKQTLHTDAGGDYEEENGVCYLQVLLSDAIPEMGKTKMFSDMDEWGYSFRLGSAQAWFEQDAEDARQWLLQRSLLPE